MAKHSNTSKKLVSSRAKQGVKAKENMKEKKVESMVNKSSEMSFLGLNYDCIEEILRRMPIRDIAAMALSHGHVCSIARNLFKRVHVQKRYKFSTPRVADVHSARNLVAMTMAFGGDIAKMLIEGVDNIYCRFIEKNMLALIARKCGGSLVDLRIKNVHIDATKAPLLAKILENVEILSFEQCTAENSIDVYDELLKNCPKLRILNVVKCWWNDASWMNRSYENLESIQLSGMQHNHDNVKSLFELNPQIKNVCLKDYVRKIPMYVGQSVLGLRKIAFRLDPITSSDDFESFHQLQHLKEVLFYSGFSSTRDSCKVFMDKISMANSLESFGFHGSAISKELCETIAKMDRLNELKFMEPKTVYENAVKILSKSLIHLHTIYLSGQVFSVEIISKFIEMFPRLNAMYLSKINTVTRDEFAELVKLRARVVADAEEYDVPLMIYVSEKSTDLIQTDLAQEHGRFIKIVSLKYSDFNAKFLGIEK